MLTPSQTIADPSGAAPSAANSSSANRILQQVSPAAKYLWSQRVWLLFIVPFAFACWKPMQNSFRNWGNPDNLLLFQSLVPFASALLIWQERAYLQALWIRLQAYPQSDKRRRGNLIPIIVGCLTMLFGHLVYVDSFFGIGLLLIVAGTIYYIYGSLMLRVLAAPLALLLLMINPPDSLISMANQRAISSTAFAASSLLSLFGRQTSVDRNFIRFPEHTIEITDPLNGANILIALLFVCFIYAWYQRRTPLYTFCFLVIAGVFVILVHLIRVSLYSLTMMGSPQVARLLLIFNPWLLVLLLGATIIYTAQSMELVSLRMRVAAKKRERQGYQSQNKSLSKQMEKALIDPIFAASDKGFTHLAAQHRKMAKSMNSFFKKVLPGKKRNGRNGW